MIGGTRWKYLLVGLSMCVAAGLAVAMTPTTRSAGTAKRIDLATLVPKSFGDWEVDELVAPLQPPPELQATVDRIYDQTLARTYRNSAGARIMLSLAYGGDQSKSMQVHRPEVCYAAQGFQIVHAAKDTLTTSLANIPVKHVLAVQNARSEPITYWIKTGDELTRDGFEWRLAQLKYGLSGRIPDGMLVRISSIDTDEAGAYALHGQFADAMLRAVAGDQRERLLGRLPLAQK
jgi:EpsI family protein